MLKIITEIWEFILIISPWLILGLLIAGLIHSFIGENFIRKNLGGAGIIPVLKATLFGIPLPVCSCSVIPIAAGLRKDGASKAATMSFLVSTPTTGIDSIFVTYAFLGGVFAIARPLAALISGLIIGMLVYLIEKEKTPEIIPHHVDHSHIPFFERVKIALNYGFKILPQDLAKTLLLGIFIGGLLSALLPTDFASTYLSNPFIAYPLMIAISVPIYVCAVGSVPIAAALLMKGLMPGAALAFLIAGPVTNTITMGFVGKKLGKKIFIIYLITIIAVASILGILLDFVMQGLEIKKMSSHGRELPYLIQLVSSILLLDILLFNSVKRKSKKRKMEYTFYVPDISCKHCQMTIEQAVKKVPGVKNIDVSIDEKVVRIDGSINKDAVVKIIQDVGYTVEKKEKI